MLQRGVHCYVLQVPSIWKFPSVLFHGIKDVKVLTHNIVVALAIIWNVNIHHDTIVQIAYGIQKEASVMQDRHSSMWHISTVDF